MLTLVLDSSAAVATAVVAEDLTVRSVRTERGSTLSLLHELTRAALADSERSVFDLDLVAVVRGPGSWTGLHVCVTTAKTIAQVADKPLVGISMLDCLARTAAADGRTVCALVDAKHDAYYSAVYDVAAGEMRAIAAPRRRSVAELADVLAGVGGPVGVVGAVPESRLVELARESGAQPSPIPHAYPTPEAFAAVAVASKDSALDGDARFALAPDYMQDDFTISSRK
jgi:tRNA threonylcarbamoyladenosine biosynthesis protein TsaB